MVSKITIFETHFDGAQFGPTTVGSEESASAAATPTAGERSDQAAGRSRTRSVLAVGGLLLVAVLGVVAARRIREKDQDRSSTDDRPADEIPAVGP